MSAQTLALLAEASGARASPTQASRAGTFREGRRRNNFVAKQFYDKVLLVAGSTMNKKLARGKEPNDIIAITVADEQVLVPSRLFTDKIIAVKEGDDFDFHMVNGTCLAMLESDMQHLAEWAIPILGALGEEDIRNLESLYSAVHDVCSAAGKIFQSMDAIMGPSSTPSQ